MNSWNEGITGNFGLGMHFVRTFLLRKNSYTWKFFSFFGRKNIVLSKVYPKSAEKTKRSKKIKELKGVRRLKRLQKPKTC